MHGAGFEVFTRLPRDAKPAAPLPAAAAAGAAAADESPFPAADRRELESLTAALLDAGLDGHGEQPLGPDMAPAAAADGKLPRSAMKGSRAARAEPAPAVRFQEGSMAGGGVTAAQQLALRLTL